MYKPLPWISCRLCWLEFSHTDWEWLDIESPSLGNLFQLFHQVMETCELLHGHTQALLCTPIKNSSDIQNSSGILKITCTDTKCACLWCRFLLRQILTVRYTLKCLHFSPKYYFWKLIKKTNTVHENPKIGRLFSHLLFYNSWGNLLRLIELKACPLHPPIHLSGC